MYPDNTDLLDKIYRTVNDERILSCRTGTYIFRYVGLISLPFCTVSVLPKYISNTLSVQAMQNYTRYTIAVLQQYAGVSRDEPGLDFLTSLPEEKGYSEPVVADALIDYYRRYGIRQKEELSYRTGGNGEVNWQQTVEKVIPVMSGHRIFYPENVSAVRRHQAEEVIAGIQRWATRYCIEKYSQLLPGSENIFFEGEAPTTPEELGPVSMLVGMLYRELRHTFTDTGIQLLQNLIWLLEQQTAVAETAAVTFYGTASFHLAWEDACKKAFGDISTRPEISSLFRPPVWVSGNYREYTTTEKPGFSNSRNVLIPDVIAYDADTLLILDAKYYLIKFRGNRVDGNPGIGDITKQILYEQTLKCSNASPFRTAGQTINGFIFPAHPLSCTDSDHDNSWYWGYIESNIPGWEQIPVHVFLIPPEVIFDQYTGRSSAQPAEFLKAGIRKNHSPQVPSIMFSENLNSPG